MTLTEFFASLFRTGVELSPEQSIVPLPPVVTRRYQTGTEHMRQYELTAKLVALYADRLLASLSPDADPDVVARRAIQGIRIKRALAARNHSHRGTR